MKRFLNSGLRVLVRGANDVGSSVAHRLFSAGYSVVIHETLQPTTARRKMSFTDAVFDSRATLEGIEARLTNGRSLLRACLVSKCCIPLYTKDFYKLLEALHPNVLVDARMRKHLQPENQRGLAPLTIGLGPNFTAGEITDVAIETNWGQSLGQIIKQGSSNPLQGEPRAIEGHARDRYVYAPVAGKFFTAREIGESVRQGEEVARIDSSPLAAPISGVLRGLTRSGVSVFPGTKVIEVDPRLQNAQISGIGERPARIAEGVLSAIQNWEANHVR